MQATLSTARTEMLSLVSLAIVAFVVTNLDDLVVLTAFSGHEQYRFREVLLGQYLGFGLLVAVSLVGGVGAATLFGDEVRLLGVLPVVVGVGWYARARRQTAGESRDQLVDGSNSVARIGLVAGVGLTDGADNVAVYVPLFAILEPGETVVVVGTFLIAAGGWVVFARWLSNRPLLSERLEAYGDVVVPVVLIGLGLVILMAVV